MKCKINLAQVMQTMNACATTIFYKQYINWKMPVHLCLVICLSLTANRKHQMFSHQVDDGSTSLLYPPVTTHMPIPTTTRTTTFKPVTTHTPVPTTIFKPGGNICLACTDSPRTQECLYTMTCETHENCYTDAFENPNGDIIFNMGCRDNQLCGSSGKREVVNRSSGNTLLCAECCTENICNAALCGQTGLPYVGPVCFKCDQASTPSSCNQITLCGRDEVCIVEKIIGLLTHATLYKSGCYHKAQCDRHAHNLSLVGRKRYDNTLMSVL
ncbi:uncharacterized protein LOC127882407 isoform X5 [Dreissena polymorpha]|uniref:uncharacterized protein LOC127882407 isoform X5 n=1 Tax=Dreissena polymorpha TaxID=45954 RepID=UPI002264DF5E|nr:uncharacterized protein LOC127882407 isoform X5 [Dreissena polymorpha]